ncbi:uroplakin-1a [Denticeps clupeoides]|uniref:Tetraspanin n=1 Tax=Denticeps clupeoides TaxID=299321 RepID=A0AAY4B0X5_9TELE|nr:uroplakin-1a [Denticeps clupeoides]XP_028836069.1 uroplakin-1a [Denticeps clupeoides]
MGDAGTTCLMVFLVLCNAVAAAAGLCLFSLSIWVAVDGYGLYQISAVSGKDDIFAGAWIAIFTGFALSCTAVFGIFAVLIRSRCQVLVYLIIMFVIFIFESASCITAATNRDYLVGTSDLVKKQMLMYYTDSSSAGQQVTRTWNNMMTDVQCCGVDGPVDWIEYNSTFRQTFGSKYPWPLYCCKRLSSFEVENVEGCQIGQSSAMFTKGCFDHIESVFSRYTWAVSWYGFSVLMFMFWVMLFTMVYYIMI